MKLQQGQVWKCGDQLVRIVHLEHLEVGYKSLKSLNSREGTHHRCSKKKFCRMLKGASLISDKLDSIQESTPDHLSEVLGVQREVTDKGNGAENHSTETAT
jgi:hypothetical protein